MTSERAAELAHMLTETRPTTGHLSPQSRSGAQRDEYHAIFIKAGYVKAADGTDTAWLIPAETLRQAVHLFEGQPC